MTKTPQKRCDRHHKFRPDQLKQAVLNRDDDFSLPVQDFESIVAGIARPMRKITDGSSTYASKVFP